VHDAAVPPGLHPGQHRAAEQHRAPHEEVQPSQVADPGQFGQRRLRLRAGGIEDKRIYRAKTAGDRGDQPGNLILISDIGEKALSDAAILTDAAADGSDLLVTGRPLIATAKPFRARCRAITAPSGTPRVWWRLDSPQMLSSG